MLISPRTALYIPAINQRALAKTKDLAADLFIIDLEDSVKTEDKDQARANARLLLDEQANPQTPIALRINGPDSPEFRLDLELTNHPQISAIVIPKVNHSDQIQQLDSLLAKPLIAMIETPTGVINSPKIAACPQMIGLIAGCNDLAHELHLPDDDNRRGLELSLQMIILAARASGIFALDGVCNYLRDTPKLQAECEAGRLLGFDGKTIIHPDHIAIANQAFAPSAKEIAAAKALIATVTANGGASRYNDKMIEAMHIASARRILARS